MIGLLLAGVLMGVILSGRGLDRADMLARAPEMEKAIAPEPAAPPEQAAVAPAGITPDFTRVAAQTVRAVTNISSVQVVRRSGPTLGVGPSPAHRSAHDIRVVRRGQ